MEVTIRVLMAVVVVIIVALIIITLATSWGSESKTLIQGFTSWLKGLMGS